MSNKTNASGSVTYAEPIVLAIDIETGSSKLKPDGSPLISVGVAIVDGNMTTIEKRRFGMPFKRADIDARTMSEFWMNTKSNPGIDKALDTFEAEGHVAGTPAEAMRRLQTFINDWRLTHPTTLVVSDNPIFDIAWLNERYGRLLDCEDLNHVIRPDGSPCYVGEVLCLRTMKRCIGMLQGSAVGDRATITEPPLPAHLAHDHYPENDAEKIACVAVQHMRYLCTKCI